MGLKIGHFFLGGRSKSCAFFLRGGVKIVCIFSSSLWRKYSNNVCSIWRKYSQGCTSLKPPHPKKKYQMLRPKTEPFLRFLTIFRSEQPVLTIFPPYIIPKRTYERIKKIAIPSLKEFGNIASLRKVNIAHTFPRFRIQSLPYMIDVLLVE